MRKSRLFLVLAVLALAAVSVVLPAGAQDPLVEELPPLTPAVMALDAGMVDETPQAWFVELSSPPAAEGTSPAVLKKEKDAFRSAARKAGIRFDEKYSYDTLFHGFSISLSRKDVAALGRIAGVKAVWPVVAISRPETTVASEPDMAHALAMTGADIAQSELGYTGAGIRVAVMDTGIDYDHPDLGGCFGPGCRVVTGWDFVGDAYNNDATSPGYHPVAVADPNPDDCNGHGTHVAGIIGGNGTVKGVAPSATFGAYRVFGCDGSTSADIMIAAMERALADGMQVLNMSIGSAFQWPEYPTAQAADRMVSKGMVVVASIGNSGSNGIYSAGAPGVGEKVIGVAAFDNTHVALATFTVSPDDKAIGYSSATAAPAPPTSGSLPMARTGTPTTANDACNPLPAGSLAGQAVLIRRGTCTFHSKALNVQNAGAAAVVLYNNSPGRFAPTVAGTPAITIPVVAISDAEGVLINNRLAAGPVTMTWTANTGTFINPTGGLISSFSSYGLAPDLSLKPDIGAPGGLIYSTFPLEQGGYAVLSGTSMSSPHVAGAVALLLEARPHTAAPSVRAILQNSADPRPWWGNPGLGFLDNVHRQGAGMLDIDDAILSTARVEPGKLALGESEAGPATRTLTITNKGTAVVTYDLGHTPALSTGPNTFTPSFSTGFAAAAFSAPSVTVPAGGSVSVDVTITANANLAARSLYGGYIVLTPQGGGQPLRVPYAGFKGDYQSIQAVAPTTFGFPWLAKWVGTSYSQQSAGATFTMSGNDVPFLLLHLDHGVARLRLEVQDAVSGRSWHRAADFRYIGRNGAATGFYAVAWDGMSYSGARLYTVPDGQYVITLSVLKAGGDAANPAHWETWTTPSFTVDRP